MITSSLQEAHALREDHNLGFPLLVIPWGAESFGLPCHVVHDTETFETAVEQAFEDSVYTRMPRIHIVSRQGFPGSFWQKNRTFQLI